MSWSNTGERTTPRQAQVAVHIVDDFTGKAPLTPVRSRLEAEGPPGTWTDTSRRPGVTSMSIDVWSQLESRARPVGLPPRSYRVVVDAEHYTPFYPGPPADGVPFLVQPHNDDSPVPGLAGPVPLYLLPGPTYPYAPHMRRLRGIVRDAAGAPVAHALVSLGSRERVFTGRRGGFVLPIRWAAVDATGLLLTVEDRVSLLVSKTIDLPADVAVVHDITLT